MFATLFGSQILKASSRSFASTTRTALDRKQLNKVKKETKEEGGLTTTQPVLVLTPEEATALEADPVYVQARNRAMLLAKNSILETEPLEMVVTQAPLVLTEANMKALVENPIYLRAWARGRKLQGGQ